MGSLVFQNRRSGFEGAQSCKQQSCDFLVLFKEIVKNTITIIITKVVRPECRTQGTGKIKLTDKTRRLVILS